MSIERLLEAARAFDRGDLDAAERTYLAVAEVDPRSTIALVGLARVALARGTDADLAQAERLAATALGHDPENAAARRLLDDCRTRTAPLPDVVTPEQGPMVDDQLALPDSEPPPGDDPLLASAPGSASASREASDSPGGSASASPEAPSPEAGEEDEFPWPDLDEQLERYREHARGRLSRFLRRRRG